jgi:hypothetical protein
VWGNPSRAGYSPITTEFAKGDHVSWKSHGGTAEGVVEEE